MSEVAEKAATEKRVVILNPNNMQLREQWRQDWVVSAEASTKIEDVLDPQYWAHMAAQMQQYARVEVLLETGEWMLDLIVLGLGRNWAQVHLLHRHDLERPAEALPAAAKHTIDWKGPQRKFAVIRISDNQLIQEGFGTRAEAAAWLVAHEKRTA